MLSSQDHTGIAQETWGIVSSNKPEVSNFLHVLTTVCKTGCYEQRKKNKCYCYSPWCAPHRRTAAISKALLTSRPQEIAEGTWAVPSVFSYHYHEICKSWSISRGMVMWYVGMIQYIISIFTIFHQGFEAWPSKAPSMAGIQKCHEPVNATMRLRS